MIISKIRIKNFRSISDVQIDFSDLTVVMGDNDAGKSNVLRAINLFFNNKTDGEKPFNFLHDFNHNAVVATNKAREIIVELTLVTPDSYQDKKDILWRKVWRRDGLYVEREIRKYADGTEFSARSKINTWLSRIKFKYVPATKGLDYFSQLLGDLHDSLSNTVDDQIKAAAKSFTTTINKHTKAIFDELEDRLSIKSSIQLPSDLKILFANLDFQADKTQISLQQRGDGIKARHIPIILRFLADQDNVLRDRGSAKYSHIWGYEEPENNLELTKAFALADDFVEYSDEVQVILTTHSPAFYRLHNQGAKIVYVSKDSTTLESTVRGIDLTMSGTLDELMGVMPLVAPHVETAVSGYKDLLAKAEALNKAAIKKPTLFVEGPSDVTILRKAISIFSPDLLDAIVIKNSAKQGGGEGWVTDMLLAWLHNRDEMPAAGLFDNDEGGKSGKSKVVENKKYEKQESVLPLILKVPPHLRNVFNKARLKIDICLEEMVGIDAWKHAQRSGWLEQRKNLIKLNPELADDFGVSVAEALASRALEKDELLYVSNRVSKMHKELFSKYVARLDADKAATLLAGFEDIVRDISRHLAPVPTEA